MARNIKDAEDRIEMLEKNLMAYKDYETEPYPLLEHSKQMLDDGDLQLRPLVNKFKNVRKLPTLGKCADISWDVDSNHIASATQDGKVIVTEVNTVSKIAFHVAQTWFQCVEFDQDDSKLIAVGGLDNLVTILKLEEESHTLGVMTTFTRHEGYISSVQWVEGNAKLLSASGDETIKLWDMNTQKLIWDMESRHKTGVLDISASPDNPNEFLSSGGDGFVRYWDIRAKGNCCMISFPCKSETSYPSVGAVKFMNNGRAFAAGTDGVPSTEHFPQGGCYARLFDIRSGAQLNEYLPNSTDDPNYCKWNFTCLDFTKDDRVLFLGDSEGYIQPFDVLTGDEVNYSGVSDLKHNNVPVASVAVSPDGSTLATAGREDTVQCYSMIMG